jgi:adenylate cyclase
MAETRKLAAILAGDMAGYSRLASVDEERTLARLRALRSDLIDPTIAVHHGRVVKRTGDGIIIEFRSAVDAVRCAIEVQNGLVERNAGLPPERRIEFRVGIHVGDVVEESDGDLMGDGVNIAARLEGIARPGAICLSEDAYRQVKARLDLKVSDLGAMQLKNIAEPIRIYSLDVRAHWDAKPAEQLASAQPAARKRRPAPAPLAAGIAALCITTIAAGWYVIAHRSAPSAGHLSVVVLPFTNLSGDTSQDYFADGITDNLTTDLSRIRNSFVIARNTSFTFKDKNVDVREIGRQLGVRYVLEGSVQRDQNRVRINAQLIDAESGAHLWADRFEDELADLFKLQDQVVARLANGLGYELVKAEASKSIRSTNPDAIDLTMRGWALLNVPGRDKIQHQQARELFERALDLDPQNAQAMVGVALVDIRDFGFRWGLHPERTLTDSIALLTKALAIDPNFSYGYYAKGVALLYAGQPSEAMESGRAGTAVDANSALSFSVMARAEGNLGHCEESLAHIKEAFRLSPRDPQSAIWHLDLGMAEFCRGRLDAAVDELKRAVDGGFRTDFAYADLAAALAQLGNDAEAKRVLAQARRLNPQINLKSFRATMPGLPQVLEGLRKAGLPEE